VPRAEFVTGLHRRLAAAQTNQDVQPLPQPRPVVDGTRRWLVVASSIAVTAAAVGTRSRPRGYPPGLDAD
jgi:hypothetical protein